MARDLLGKKRKEIQTAGATSARDSSAHRSGGLRLRFHL